MHVIASHVFKLKDKYLNQIMEDYHFSLGYVIYYIYSSLLYVYS